MTIEPPQPPTAPAPAVRPTPPTPPRIDKTPFARDTQAGDDSQTGDDQQAGNSEQQATDDAEAMAREAVANGSGPLTKRTVNRAGDERQAQPPTNRNADERQAQPPANQTVTVIPPDAPLVSEGQSDYDRGQDVLRQFRELDAGENQSGNNRPALSSKEQPPPAAPHLSYDEGHGVVYWLFAIIFVAVASFVIVKKFLLTDKPALTKSQLFADSTDRLQAAADKVKPARTTSPPVKTPPPPKKDDERGKHFEVRI